MSDETYSLVAMLSFLAAAASLWFRYKHAKGTRRLAKLLAPTLLLAKLEDAKRLLSEAAGDSRRKRPALLEAASAASTAGRALAYLRSERPEVAVLERDILALVALLESLPMLTNPSLDEKIRVALERVNDIAERVKRNLPSANSYRAP